MSISCSMSGHWSKCRSFTTDQVCFLNDPGLKHKSVKLYKAPGFTLLTANCLHEELQPAICTARRHFMLQLLIEMPHETYVLLYVPLHQAYLSLLLQKKLKCCLISLVQVYDLYNNHSFAVDLFLGQSPLWLYLMHGNTSWHFTKRATRSSPKSENIFIKVCCEHEHFLGGNF